MAHAWPIAPGVTLCVAHVAHAEWTPSVVRFTYEGCQFRAQCFPQHGVPALRQDDRLLVEHSAANGTLRVTRRRPPLEGISFVLFDLLHADPCPCS